MHSRCEPQKSDYRIAGTFVFATVLTAVLPACRTSRSPACRGGTAAGVWSTRTAVHSDPLCWLLLPSVAHRHPPLPRWAPRARRRPAEGGSTSPPPSGGGRARGDDGNDRPAGSACRSCLERSRSTEARVAEQPTRRGRERKLRIAPARTQDRMRANLFPDLAGACDSDAFHPLTQFSVAVALLAITA